MEAILRVISRKTNKRGFTLVELIIAMAMLSILTIAALAAFNPFEQLKKSNDAKRKSDLAQLQRALQQYYEDNGSYPSSSSDFKIVNKTTKLNWGGSWSPYMTKLPADPLPSDNYVYYSPSGQSYYLYSVLEEGAKDSGACNKGNPCQSLTAGVSGFPSANACGGTCEFGLSSPNVTP